MFDMKMDDKGITLVELMIALAVSTVVILGATVFLSTSQNNYQREKTRIDLQQEAQIATSQITNMLLEASETEVSLHPVSGKTMLRIYGMPTTGGILVNEIYQDADNKLRLNQGVTNSGITYTYQNELLADYVDAFGYAETVPSSVTGRRLGTLKLDLKAEHGKYHSENQVVLRNSSK